MTSQATLDQRARDRMFGDPKVRAYLDTLAYPDLVGLIHAPVIVTQIAQPVRPRWAQGDPRPSLADEDPATMAAIARCAVARWRRGSTYGTEGILRAVSDRAVLMHPDRCGWCDYPADELLRALDWGLWHGQYVTGEQYVWAESTSPGCALYVRPTGRHGYMNPRWKAFTELPRDDQRTTVDAVVAASRAMLEPDPAPIAVPDPLGAPGAVPGVAHDPWCTADPDHTGGCPPPPDDDA